MSQFKLLLCAGAAVGALVATDASAAVKHKKHTVTRTTTTRPSANAELLEEVRDLKAQVASLKSRVDSQTGDSQTNLAQLQSTQARIDAVQAKVDATDTKVAAIPSTVTVAVDKATDKARHADKFYFKGITITPGGFLELAGIYRAHNTATDIASNFNALPYPNVAYRLPQRRPLLCASEPPVVPRPGRRDEDDPSRLLRRIRLPGCRADRQLEREQLVQPAHPQPVRHGRL